MSSQEEVISFCWNQSAGIPLLSWRGQWFGLCSEVTTQSEVQSTRMIRNLKKNKKKRLVKRFIHSSSEATRKQREKFSQMTLKDF